MKKAFTLILILIIATVGVVIAEIVKSKPVAKESIHVPQETTLERVDLASWD